MTKNFKELAGLFAAEPRAAELLSGGKWGLEKEALRVTPAGELALTPHPAVFGDKLRNPHITVDFSESQLELITPPCSSTDMVHASLAELQSQVVQGLPDELLWPLSMPARLPAEERIPPARFDDSPAGREKNLYREGLARRYGKRRQLISGIHYNFSFAPELLDYLGRRYGRGGSRREFSDRLYSAVARNFLRYRWLLIYLLGASPSFDATFAPVIEQELAGIKKCCPAWYPLFTSYLEYATSLRVSQFGYAGSLQARFFVSFNSPQEYIKDIRRLLALKSKHYAELGLVRDGLPIQLNDKILQKESEFYSPLRFKQICRENETQLTALEKRGVGYLEIRTLDLDPFQKTGISRESLSFLQVFMLFCLFEPSPLLSKEPAQLSNRNHHLVAIAGRTPGLKLYRTTDRQSFLTDWSEEIFGKLAVIAGLLDKNRGGGMYQNIVREEYRKILAPALLPSARIRQEMAERQEGHLEFGLRRAAGYLACEACEKQETVA